MSLYARRSQIVVLLALSRRDKSAGHLISFAQFAFIAAEGFVQSADRLSTLSETDDRVAVLTRDLSLSLCDLLLRQFDFRSFRLRPRVIPLLVYFRLVCLFFAATVLNNIALDYHISIPVHTVFRSSGLAGTLLTGYLFYNKR